MMKKDTNTMTLNLEVKSNLAKLLATENITIQHNKVKTASFDVKNRVLTLPLFKQKSGDVYDMLIAHECAHALWTPYCLLYTSPSPRDLSTSRMPSSA